MNTPRPKSPTTRPSIRRAAAATRPARIGHLLGALGVALCTVSAAIAVAPAPAAAANGTNVYSLLGGWSQHVGTERELNEVHWGVGLEVERQVGSSWALGGTVLNFTNSYDNRSTYLGAVAKRCIDTGESWRGCAGLTVGVVNGYDQRNGGGFAPAGSAVADLSYGRFGAGLVCGPTPNGNGVCLGLLRLRLY